MSNDEARFRAVEQLELLGLSTYAARTFVALVTLENGTAKDVSEVVDVPRTRVYDAAEELQERGLVDVQQSTPKRFWAVSVETGARRFEREYVRRVGRLTEALETLEPAVRKREQRGVWTVTGRETVSERVVDFIEAANEEIVYVTADVLVTDSVVDQLRAAGERGVAVEVAGPSSELSLSTTEEWPNASVVEVPWNLAETPVGRLLVVDREQTLVSVLVDGEGDHPPEPLDETAIWGAGPTNNLVVVLRALLGGRPDGDDA